MENFGDLKTSDGLHCSWVRISPFLTSLQISPAW